MTDYATFAEYTAAETADRDDQTYIESLIASASRMIDAELKLAAGMLAPQNAKTFRFDLDGRPRLRLAVGRRGFPLRSLTSASLEDAAGASTVLTVADDLVLQPRNNDELAEPYTHLRLTRTDSPTVWTEGGVAVLEGDWGWAAIPEAVTNLTIALTRQMQDSQRGGGTATIAPLEDAVPLVPDGWRLWRQIKRTYSMEGLARR